MMKLGLGDGGEGRHAFIQILGRTDMRNGVLIVNHVYTVAVTGLFRNQFTSVAAHLFFIRRKYRHELCAQIWLDGNQTLHEASSDLNPKPNHVFTVTDGCRGSGTLRLP